MEQAGERALLLQEGREVALVFVSEPASSVVFCTLSSLYRFSVVVDGRFLKVKQVTNELMPWFYLQGFCQ